MAVAERRHPMKINWQLDLNNMDCEVVVGGACADILVRLVASGVTN